MLATTWTSLRGFLRCKKRWGWCAIHNNTVREYVEEKSEIYWSSSPRKGETVVLCLLGSQGNFSASNIWINQSPPCAPGHPAVCSALKIPRVWFTSSGSTSALKLPLEELVLPGEWWAFLGNDTIYLLWHGMNHTSKILAPHREPLAGWCSEAEPGFGQVRSHSVLMAYLTQPAWWSRRRTRTQLYSWSRNQQHQQHLFHWLHAWSEAVCVAL